MPRANTPRANTSRARAPQPERYFPEQTTCTGEQRNTAFTQNNAGPQRRHTVPDVDMQNNDSNACAAKYPEPRRHELRNRGMHYERIRKPTTAARCHRGNDQLSQRLVEKHKRHKNVLHRLAGEHFKIHAVRAPANRRRAGTAPSAYAAFGRADNAHMHWPEDVQRHILGIDVALDKAPVRISKRTDHGYVHMHTTRDVLERINAPVTQETCPAGWDTTWHHENVELGEIIRVPTYAPNFNPDLAMGLQHDDIAYSSRVGTIVAKPRPVLVIGYLPGGLLTLPIGSANGNGRDHYAAAAKQYLVRVLAADDAVQFQYQNEDLVLTHKLPGAPYGGFKPSANSFLDMGKTLTVEFRTPMKREHGGVDNETLKSVVESAYNIMERGIAPLRAWMQGVGEAALWEQRCKDENVRLQERFADVRRL